MSYSGFPDYINVKIGSKFNGNNGAQGAGLNTGDDLTLKRVGATNEWTEDGTNTPSKAASNRIKIVVSGSGRQSIEMYPLFISPPPPAPDQWASQHGAWAFIEDYPPFGTLHNYAFLNIWDRVATPTTLYAFVSNFAAGTNFASSWSGNGITAGSDWDAVIIPMWRGNVFSLFEDGTPPSALGPDKTSYHYG